MSAKAMGLVWDCDLPHSEVFILLALADHADHNFENIYPSIETLCFKTNYSRRQVQYVMKSLRDSGALVVVDKIFIGRGFVNRYKIDFSAIPQKSRIVPGRAQPLRPSEAVRGATIAPLPESRGAKSCINERKILHISAQNPAQTSAIAIAPKPSVTVINHQEPGKEPATPVSPIEEKKKKSKAPEKPESPDFRPFIEFFESEYLKVSQSKYLFQGGRDGKAVSELLKAEPDLAKLKRIVTACLAHPSGFYCKKGQTIWGLAKEFNEIRGELNALREKNKNPTSKPVNPVATRIALENDRKRAAEKVEHWKAETHHNHDKTPEKLKSLREALKTLADIDVKLSQLPT